MAAVKVVLVDINPKMIAAEMAPMHPALQAGTCCNVNLLEGVMALGISYVSGSRRHGNKTYHGTIAKVYH